MHNSATVWFSFGFDRFCQAECVWALASIASVPQSCVLQFKTVNFNQVDFIWAKNWLLSAYCQIFLSTEQILLELWWHVYQNEVNVDPTESYLAGVRMLNFAINIFMRNSSNTTTNINKHGRFVSF